MNRLDDITRATDNLDRCVRERGKHQDEGTRWGITMGECDWYEELHRLLYEENTQMLTAKEQREVSEQFQSVRVAEEIDGRQIARDAIAAARRAHTQDGPFVGKGIAYNAREASEAKAAAFGMGDGPVSAGHCPCSYCTSRRASSTGHVVGSIRQLTTGAPGAGVCVPAKPPTTGMFAGMYAKDQITAKELLDKIVPVPPATASYEELVVKSALQDVAMRGIGGGPTRATTLPAGAADRKTYPVASGVLDYFPDAIAAISHLSWKGNEQHNPGQPLHWARGKSTDEADTMLRHFLQRGTVDNDGIRHSVKMAWRALALLQKELEGGQTPQQ